MKSINLSVLLLCATLSVSAQRFQFKTTACAENILESYSRLIARVGVSSCNYPLITSVTGYMQCGCYSPFYPGAIDSGHVTFESFLDERNGGAFFRTIWDKTPAVFTYYGVCPPNVVVWDMPYVNGTVNHVYEAFLIKAKDYQNNFTSGYSYLRDHFGIKSDELAQILGWYIEPNDGWAATHKSADYGSPNSSIGLVVGVKLNTGDTVKCYMINNYDEAGTMNWKTLARGVYPPEIPEKHVEAIPVKLVSAALEQNSPNPANGNTRIGFMLPDKYSSAVIRITGNTGITLKEIKLNGNGNGAINANVQNLNAGIYKYSLIIDGRIIDTKTMIISK